MTIAAREVLDDCRGALAELDGVQGPVWRRRWITAVVLLRTVGHVLFNVDRERSQAYKKAITAARDSLKNSKPKNQIFWDFIENERNNILKQYQISAGQGATVYLGPSRSVDYHYVINTGPFAELDQRDLLRQAISWWEKYLDEIDTAASGDAP